jgi:hypothetical protein
VSSVSDLLLHLRPCALEVTFDGAVYTLEAMDAVEWIVHLEGPHPDLYAIFPTKAGLAAVEHVEDALWEGRATTEDVGEVGLAAIALAADRPWWVVLKLLAAARESWSIVHVNKATGMSLAGWLDEVWSKIMEHIDPKKRAGWITDIESPPKGIKAELDFDAEEQAFLNAMKAVMR